MMNSQELELLRLRISNLKRKLKTEPTTSTERRQRPWDKLQLSKYERELKNETKHTRRLIVEDPWKSALVRLKAMEKQRIADQSARDQAAN